MPFRTIVGQKRIVTILSRAVAGGSLPPSLIFAGPRGVGKRTTAVALAEAINCTSPARAGDEARMEPRRADGVEHDACGECASCRRIARGVHPDVVIVEPGDSGSIKIEQIRPVIDAAGYRPFEGRRRAVVIDEADAMVPAAQSALLKTLEEPPSASIFVLVSSVPDALLPTVRSRCPRLRFGPLTPDELVSELVARHDFSESEARAAAADAGGSLGRALGARSADLVGAREDARRLLEQTARLTDPARRLELVKDLTGRKKTPAEEREQLATCLHALASLLRDVAVLGTQADRHLVANADLGDVLARLSGAFDAERSGRAFRAVDEALTALGRNANPKIVADWLVLQL